jgi:hypothetical protein
MQPPRRYRLTIGHGMAAIAVLAGLLAMPRPWLMAGVKIAALLAPVFFLASFLVEVVFGIRCPGCGCWTLRRLAGSSGYHGCSSCRGRFKRRGDFAPWLDASGPEDAPRYRRRPASRLWLGYVPPEDASDTIPGVLLRNKRRRTGWAGVFRLPFSTVSRPIAASSEPRPQPGEGFDVAREAGETTSGVLLRSKKRRRGSS